MQNWKIFTYNTYPPAYWINKQGDSKAIDKEIIIKYTLDYLNKVGIKTTKNPKCENPKCIYYDKIQQKFQLNDRRDFVWMKFTRDGYLGAVAVSDDVSFDMPEDCSVYDKKHAVYNSYKKAMKKNWFIILLESLFINLGGNGKNHLY